MDEDNKNRIGMGLMFGLLAVALAALVVLGVLGPGAGHVASVALLSVVAVIIGAAIAATINLLKSEHGGKLRSPRQKAGAALVAGLVAVGIVAMVVLAVNFGVGELEKAALGGLIVLVGTGVTAVLSMLRSERARQEAVHARNEAAAARQEHTERARRDEWARAHPRAAKKRARETYPRRAAR